MRRKEHTNPHHFKLEISKNQSGMTSFAGLPLLREALMEFGLIQEMKKIYLKRAGFADEIILEAIILLLAAGGTSFSDWDYLAKEVGFQKIFGECPSVDVLENYFRRLVLTPCQYDCDNGQGGYTTILESLQRTMIKIAYKLAGSPRKLSLDLDASVIETNKSEALFHYEKGKAYQPFVAYCPELRMITGQEFRDGNISPQAGYQRLVERCVSIFPKRVKWVIRSDSAGYQFGFLNWLQDQGMVYYVTTDKCPTMMHLIDYEKGWKCYISKGGIKTNQEYAEIPYVVMEDSQQELKLRSNQRRFIALKKPKDGQLKIGEDPYVYQVIITNNHKECNVNHIIRKHWQRCGSVEYCFSQIKSQCGMKKMPSSNFAVNAAWFSLGCLTHNVLRVFQSHVLPKNLKKCELHTLRFRFIRSAALIKHQAKQTIVRFCKGHMLIEIYQEARLRLDKVIYRLQMA